MRLFQTGLIALLLCFAFTVALPPTVPAEGVALSLKCDAAARHEKLDTATLAKLRPSLDLYLIPDPIDPRSFSSTHLPAWTFTDSLTHLERLMHAGFPVIVGGSRADNTTFSYLNPDPEQMEDDTRVTQTINLFDAITWQECLRQLRERVRQIEARGGNIEAHSLNIGSNWGEIEYYIGNDIHRWEKAYYSGYSPSGQRSFRDYLKRVYQGNIAALNHAWGMQFRDWEQAPQPKPHRAVPNATFDGRPEWLDFNRWRTDRLTDAVAEMAQTSREVTQRPLEVLISFAQTKGAAGPAVGELAKRFSQFTPVYFHCTDGHSAAAVRYLDSVRRFYKIPTYLVENDGDRFLYHSTLKLVMNGLMGGADRIDYCAVYNLGVHRQGDYRAYPNDVYYLLREVERLTSGLEMERPATQSALLNSTFSRYVRAPYYHNLDVQGVYDEVLNQTRSIAGWGTALGYPDVIDEQMIADGRLQGLKLLIIPNTSFTVVPEPVMAQIRAWVREGGWLVVTGTGALLHQLKADHSVALGDATQFKNLIGGLLVEDSLNALRPQWHSDEATTHIFQLSSFGVKSLQAGVSLPAETRLFAHQWLEADAGPAWEPLLVHEPGAATNRIQAAAWIQHTGRGAVLFCSAPVPEPHLFGWQPTTNAQNVEFYRSVFPALLQSAARRAGVNDIVRSSGLRISTLGTNRRDGQPTYMAFSLNNERGTTQLEFPEQLGGRQVHLMIFGQPLTAAYWTNGAQVTFTQPSLLQFWQDPTNAVLDNSHPVMAPYADFRLQIPTGNHDRRLQIEW